MNIDYVFVNVAEAWLRIWSPDGVIEVQPVADGRGGPRPDGDDLAFLTAWNRGGRPEEPETNDANHRSMIESLERNGVSHVRAALLGADASWAQPGVAVSGAARADALGRARALGQPVLITWTADHLVTVAIDGHRTETTGWTSRLLDALPCPVHPPGQHRRKPCKMNGGPYGSRAMSAAAEWSSRRSSLLRCTECDVCGGGRPIQPQGTGIILVATQDPAPGDANVFVEPQRYLDQP